VDIYLQAVLNPTLDGSVCLTSRAARFTLEKQTLVGLEMRLNEAQRLRRGREEKKKVFCTGKESNPYNLVIWFLAYSLRGFSYLS
jgi:hypothetical protein